MNSSPNAEDHLRAANDPFIGGVAALPRKLSVRELAATLGVSKSWLDKKRLDGSGPPYLKLGRRVVYDVNDFEAWAAQFKRQQTA